MRLVNPNIYFLDTPILLDKALTDCTPRGCDFGSSIDFSLHVNQIDGTQYVFEVGEGEYADAAAPALLG